MLIPAAFAAKGVLSVEFDREDVAFATCNLLCTLRTEGTVGCATLMRHLAAGLGSAAACTVHPSVEPESVLGFALSTAWHALSVTNP